MIQGGKTARVYAVLPVLKRESPSQFNILDPHYKFELIPAAQLELSTAITFSHTKFSVRED